MYIEDICSELLSRLVSVDMNHSCTWSIVLWMMYIGDRCSELWSSLVSDDDMNHSSGWFTVPSSGETTWRWKQFAFKMLCCMFYTQWWWRKFFYISVMFCMLHHFWRIVWNNICIFWSLSWRGANKKQKYFLNDYLGGLKTEKNEDPVCYRKQNRSMVDFAPKCY